MSENAQEATITAQEAINDLYKVDSVKDTTTENPSQESVNADASGILKTDKDSKALNEKTAKDIKDSTAKDKDSKDNSGDIKEPDSAKDKDSSKDKDKDKDSSKDKDKDKDSKDNSDNASQKDNKATWEEVQKAMYENKDVALEKEIVDSFIGFAKEHELDPAMATRLYEWQLKEAEAAKKRFAESGRKELQKEWGKDFDTNKDKTLNMIASIDRVMDNKFSKALAQCGATCHADIVKGLYEISKQLDEDTIGGGRGQANSEKQETAFEAISNLFKSYKKK